MHPNTEITAATAGARRVPGFPFPISRRTDPVSIRPGVRVIVRHLPLVDHGDAQDVIGPLISVDPLVVRGKQGTVEIDPRGVVVLKTLSSKPVRNSDIRAVEEAKAEAFPGLANEWIGGWLARAGDGITERSNSAVPLGPEAAVQPVPVEGIKEFYARHNLPPQLLVPDRIGRTAEHLEGHAGPEIIVMFRELGADDEALATVTNGAAAATTGNTTPAADNGAPTVMNGSASTAAHRAPVAAHKAVFTVADEASPEWLSLYNFRGQPLPPRALELLTARIDGSLGFASLHIDDALVAVSRGTVTRGGRRHMLGFSAVEVIPSFRRQGLATLMCQQLLQWGRAHGADCAYLDVLRTNEGGRGLYHGLGFSEHHRVRSLVL
ncbi:GNAT family N-acetyltransferase [Corynebacterium auriscanis]|uniref:Acetyltransferase n=1 Tax=Corynebacterium auriscanis TaxID=99807 RepID=A0A0A2DP10_9CORY|nr:GNAT family N-acetyltransferase [Corynebacterium auriscanis]KGM18626.1 acetyltransferase [Corynebacterium auriscanis]WJY72036.1 Acetyltransferase (GNAT) family protein [Corynebacterium auriscanis]